MRTSRVSKETAKVLQALSSPSRRQTRASLKSSALKSFSLDADQPANVSLKTELPEVSEDDTSSLSSVNTVDIEDILEPPSKRRKRNISTTTTPSTSRSSSRLSRKVSEKHVQPKTEDETTVRKTRKTPARRIQGAGASKTGPPPNWEIMYNAVKKMREENPTAPVDSVGCAELYWRGSSPRDRRFQTLIALMLSSQTKDTTTAVAMQRLHTELGDGGAVHVEPTDIKKEEDVKPFTDSTLNLENILAVSPERLNELIRVVGFHNNKTKYIKAAALILRDQYNSDIPPTAEELMKLPGVGPKMAYLCMSAAWGKDEGIGVDVHVHRITNLWGWNKTKTPEETRKALQSWLPRNKWHEINKLLVGLGQTVCLPVGRRCGDCCLSGMGLCKSEIKGLALKRAKETALPDKSEVKIEEDMA
ncbi:Endonuclease III-like protein 1 [Monascus purpureus]|uniref:Endonuclease III homolog n=1 Tax=Monascus purpureus TaxID=5098 RepID=A0A507QW95_MONPU|nr:Endonuclease III-like protein 1 [Monascus purpureus]BDD57789.1 alpha,alpha-trehalase nth1 [Monascus purpureus]